MYQISRNADALFRKEYRQVARLTVTMTGVADPLIFTENDIVQGSLSIERDMCSGNNIELGATVSSALKVSLYYADAENRIPDGADASILVEIGIKKWDAYQWENAQIEYVRMGTFKIVKRHTVKVGPRKHSDEGLDPVICEILAYDSMIKFDKPVDATQITTPITVKNLIIRICTLCNVTLGDYVDSMVNKNYEVTTIPTGITYRQLLSQCGFMIASPCAYIKYNDELAFMNYDQEYIDMAWDDDYSDMFNIKQSERYKLIDESDFSYFCTGVMYHTSDGETVVEGENNNLSYAIEYTGCDIFDYDEYYGPDVPRPLPDPYENSPIYKIASTIAYDLEIGHGSIAPIHNFMLETVPLPWLYPGYMLYLYWKFNEYEQKSISVYVGHYRFTMNKRTEISLIIDDPGTKQPTNYYDGSTQ